MTAVAHDGNVKIYFATTVASTAAPTVANISAATLLPGVTNFQTPNSEAEVDYSDVDSLYDTGGVGTTKAGPIVLTMKRDDTDESDTWELLDTPRATGFLIFSRFGAAVATSAVEVYPVQVGQRRPASYARNTAQMFDVSFYVTSAPNLDAVVAA